MRERFHMNDERKFVLLVEDDPNDARLIQRCFDRTALPVQVMRLQDGDEAVAYLDGVAPYDNRVSHPLPCVVLLDLKLPRRSGLEVLQWIRSRTYELRRLPVVMLTSSHHAVDINRAYDLGANSYLVKPETIEQLTELVGLVKRYWLTLNRDPRVTVS